MNLIRYCKGDVEMVKVKLMQTNYPHVFISLQTCLFDEYDDDYFNLLQYSKLRRYGIKTKETLLDSFIERFDCFEIENVLTTINME